jgi:hypothetical protein
MTDPPPSPQVGSKIRSEFFLDGMPNEKLNLVAFSPSPDAVGEMRVQTNAYDAEYGPHRRRLH